MADGRLQQRVTVGRGLGDEITGNVPAGTGAVFDDDLLAVERREPLRGNAAQNIGNAARRCRADDAYGFCRICGGLRVRA